MTTTADPTTPDYDTILDTTRQIYNSIAADPPSTHRDDRGNALATLLGHAGITTVPFVAVRTWGLFLPVHDLGEAAWLITLLADAGAENVTIKRSDRPNTDWIINAGIIRRG